MRNESIFDWYYKKIYFDVVGQENDENMARNAKYLTFHSEIKTGRGKSGGIIVIHW